MACDFQVPFTGDPQPLLQKAKAAVESQGGVFSGDEISGSFDVTVFGNRVAGTYSVAADVLSMHIHTKPFMVPCSMIESFLVNQLT